MHLRGRDAVGRRAEAVLALACVCLLGLTGVASAASIGSLSQAPGAPGCVEMAPNAEGCTPGIATGEATKAVVSPDGRNVYVGSANSNAVDVFSRDPVTGTLTQLGGTAGCVQETGGTDNCTPGRGLTAAKGVGISPDGRFVYVASEGLAASTAAIAIFARDATTGALTQLAGTSGCLERSGGPDGCAVAKPLESVRDLVISPDGRNLYVPVPSTAADGDVGTLLVFNRDLQTGALTQPAGAAGCIQGAGGTDGCTAGRALHEADGVAMSPDGRYVYLAASEGHATNQDGALDTFVRDPLSGALTQLAGAAGCTDKTGTDETNVAGSCATGIGLHDADELVVTADGTSVYVAGQGTGSTATTAGALTAFTRNPETGVVTQLAGTAGCVTQDGGDGEGGALGQCTIGRAIFEPSGLAASPDGRNVYVATSDAPGALVTLARDSTTSAVTQLSGTEGCISIGGSDGTGTTCAVGRGLLGANDVAISPDGESVYVPGQDNNSVATLERNDLPPSCAPGSATIVNDGTAKPLTLSCSDPLGAGVQISVIGAPSHGTLSALNPVTGTISYVPAQGSAGADSFAFQSTDGSESSNPATFSLNVQAPPSPPPPPVVPPIVPPARAPALSALTISPSAFFAVRSARHRKTGTVISYRDSQAATTTLTVLRPTRGLRRGRSCVAAPRKPRRGQRRCTLYVRLGTFAHKDSAGVNRLRFSGRLRGRALKPGSYRLQAQARTPGKLVSAAVVRSFTIRR